MKYQNDSQFFLFELTNLILLISITFPTNVFAAPISTTTITSVKAENKTIKVKWKKRANITGYQIQVATDKKFKKNAKTVVVKKQKTTTATIKKLKSKKKYYVRIRTYKNSNNKKIYSPWSKVKSTKTPKTTKCKEDNIKKEIENHCTNNNNHSIKCGNMGKWFNSRSELVAYYNSEVSKWNKKIDNEEITYDEYYKNVPSGYECWSCSYCGKWTGNLKHY